VIRPGCVSAATGKSLQCSSAAYERQQAIGDSTAFATAAFNERPQNGLLNEAKDLVPLSPKLVPVTADHAAFHDTCSSRDDRSLWRRYL
jgi:hypothetical protein